MNPTIWWQSKQLWAAVIVAVATAVQAKYGFVIDPATQGYIVSAIMVILRLVTIGPVAAKKEQ
jgi:hypothetical protein